MPEIGGYERHKLSASTPAASGELGLVNAKLVFHNGSIVVTPNIEPFILHGKGTLAVATGVSKVPLTTNYRVESVRARVNTAPTGASLILDLNKNGTTMYSTQGNRPTIISGNLLSSSTLPDVLTFADGDYFSIDIDQVGSSVAGADLVVVIRLRELS